ncbi:MAG: GNAT family N-acetyltransferase [Solirubrobacteraceae bacterium]
MRELRPSRGEDREAVLRLLAQRDQADFGEDDFTRALVLDHWRGRDFIDEADAVVMEDGGELVAWAAVFGPGTLALVHPEREGEGMGSELLRWTEERAKGRDFFRQRVAASNLGARALLESAGYRLARGVHNLTISPGGTPPVAAPPAGMSIDPIELPRDSREIFEADGRGFAENPDYEPAPFQNFCDEHLSCPELHLASSAIARSGGLVAGFVLCRKFDRLGFIDLLCVDPTERRRGLGTALLLHAITRLVKAGAPEVRLDVASDNPTARRLYERAGMTPCQEIHVLEKPAAAPRTRPS